MLPQRRTSKRASRIGVVPAARGDVAVPVAPPGDRHGTRRRPAGGRLVALLALGVTWACSGAAPGGAAPPDPAPRAGPTGPDVPAAMVPGDLPSALELVADLHVPRGGLVDELGGLDLGGLSGIFFDAATSTLTALSDSPTAGRVFTFRLEVAATGPAGHDMRLHPLASFTLEVGDPPRLWDPEGLAPGPDGSWYAAFEGQAAVEPRLPPAVGLFSARGELLELLPVPEHYVPEVTGAPTRGVRHNLGLESLTVSPGGGLLFAATESALLQDGPVADFGRPGIARILVFDLTGPAPGLLRELAYPLEPVPPVEFRPDFRVNGLSELLALGPDDLLALERAYVADAGGGPGRNTIRIWHVELPAAAGPPGADAGGADAPVARGDLPGGTPPQGEDPPPGGSASPSTATAAELERVSKRLILDLDDVVGRFDPDFPGLDNFEGMAFGPVLADGSRSLLVISDDNFNATQRTVLLLFRIVPSG